MEPGTRTRRPHDVTPVLRLDQLRDAHEVTYPIVELLVPGCEEFAVDADAVSIETPRASRPSGPRTAAPLR
ncbi:hypothetical protein AB0I54_00660 [Streptomyces sp. NPDC050625]|uniref:hypothetical protein n=1 Tax=Streptomyces sp. NPDC050625 TaxID=3154629 RepID=UPI00341F5972